ncbi:MAG: alpha/beta hydrolase [Ornithinimicrobium sp.]
MTTNSTPPSRVPHRLAHDIRGHGDPAVVFLHGVFMDRHLWDHVELEGVRAVCVDMPGHGHSRLVPGASIDDHARAVADVLDHHGLDAPITVGHSWGGMVGLRIARDRQLSGLFLVNTPLRRTRGVARLGFILQRAMLGLGLPAKTYGKLAAAALIGEETRKARPELASDTGERARAIGRRGLRETLRSVLIESDDTIDLLASLEAPWTFVAGRDDYVISNGFDTEIRRYGTLHVVDGAHTTPLEAPEDLNQILKDFLAERG